VVVEEEVVVVDLQLAVVVVAVVDLQLAVVVVAVVDLQSEVVVVEQEVALK
jgi:hypothetical protein